MIHLSRMMNFALRDALISQFVHPLFFRTNIFLFFIYLIYWLIGDCDWYEIPLYKRTYLLYICWEYFSTSLTEPLLNMDYFVFTSHVHMTQGGHPQTSRLHWVK